MRMEKGKSQARMSPVYGRIRKMRRKIVWESSLIAALGISLTIPWYAKAAWNTEVFIVLSFLGVIPVAISAVRALVKRKVTIDLLASVALGFAFIAGEWYSAVFINLMLAFARLFDAWTEERVKRILSQMMKYLPEKVKIKKGEDVAEIPLSAVREGDLVVVEAGDRIPVDGTVVSGQASINEANLTGESELVIKKEGDMVYSSTLNEGGSLYVKAEKVGSDSRLVKMAALVEEASRRKARGERVADKFSEWYVISMLVFALAGYVFMSNRQMVLAILLVVCADDIAVAVPLTFTVAIARGARMGMILKGSEVIEKMSKLKFVVTDKTGTLTMGKPRVVEVRDWEKGSKKEFWRILGMAAGSSHHPVSRAITEYVQKQGEEILAPQEFQEAAGEGIEVKGEGKTWWLGKIDYLTKKGIKLNAEQEKAVAEARDKGYGLSALGEGKKLRGLVELEDAVRPHAKKVIEETRRLGVAKWWMLTGDNERVAAQVAREVGIDEYHANLLPEQKIAWIDRIKKENPGMVGMIGDGVNDAAALALADVSMAMGVIGSDAAIEAADVALIKDSLVRIPQAMTLGKKALGIVRQEFVIWGVTNAVGLGLVLSGVMGPSWAAAYNFLTDFFPILNALRLSGVRIDSVAKRA